MKIIPAVLFAVVGTIALAHNVNAQGHYHLHVAADGKNQGDPLHFDNEDGVSAEDGFVSTLSYTNGGRYAGYYQGNLTTDVLSINVTNTAYSPDAAAPGSWIFLQLASLDGPSGGSFGFWETNALVPSVSLVSGTTGTNGWLLGENNGSPGTDPYGHIHGRRYTATKPGIYTVGFRAVDFSTNGTGGNAIHTPSEIFHVYFQAGVSIKSISRENDVASVTVGATGGQDFVLEYSLSMGETNSWQQTGGVISGDDHFVNFPDPNATNAMRFYRVRQDVLLGE